MKIASNLKKFYQYAFPMQAALVTCKDKQRETNIITVAWHTPISVNPSLYGVSISPKRHSHKLIVNSKEFVVNFAPIEIIEKIHYCGTHSGRSINKVKETGLSLIPATKVDTPLIKECYAHLECKLTDTIKLGDHSFIIGEVVAVDADENAFNKDILKIDKIKPIYYLGENTYTTLNEHIIKKF